MTTTPATPLDLERLVERATPRDESHAPELELRYLDNLWLQVTGTLCNLACLHCFITCGPKNDSHPMMSVEQVREALEGALGVGVREYYFTGGEPFMHPHIFELIEMTLEQGPLSILTNGVLIDAAAAQRLRSIFDASRYSLDLRVSLDGTTAAQNDPIRGRGSYDKIMAGVRELANVGLNPVLTVTEVNGSDAAQRAEFRELLRSVGLPKTRLEVPVAVSDRPRGATQSGVRELRASTRRRHPPRGSRAASVR